MNDTANIPSGKVTAHIVADSIQLPKQKTSYCDFHNAHRIAVARSLDLTRINRRIKRAASQA